MNELQQPQFPAPLPYKNRRGWLIAFGIVQLLIACFFLLMAAIMAFGIASMPKTGQQLPTAVLYVVSLMYAGVAAVFVITGVGSIRAKDWARILIIVLSWLWLVLGVFSVLFAAVIMPAIIRQQETIMEQQPGTRPMPDNFQSMFIIIMVVVETVTMVLLPLVFILFYSNKNVKATCLGSGAAAPSFAGPAFVPAPVSATPKPTLPVPILILVIWFIFSALSCAITALWIPIAGVMGHVLHGAAAHALVALYALISIYCAWSFYKLKIEGWWVALLWYGFSACSTLISAFRLDLLAIQRQAGLMNPESEKIFQTLPHFFTVIQFGSAVFTVVLFIFVWTTRRYFQSPAQ